MKKKSALLIMILFISTFSYGRINNIRQNNIFLQQLRKQEDTLPKKVRPFHHQVQFFKLLFDRTSL